MLKKDPLLIKGVFLYIVDMFWNILGKNKSSDKTDWQYYKSDSIYIKDEWGEIRTL